MQIANASDQDLVSSSENRAPVAQEPTLKFPLGWARAAAITTGLLCSINALSLATRETESQANFALKTATQVFDLGHHLALGLIIISILWLWGLAKLKLRYSLLALGLAYFGLAFSLLDKDLENLAWRLMPNTPWLISAGSSLMIAFGACASIALSIKFPHWVLRALYLPAGIVALALNHQLPSGYPGVHLFLALLGGGLVSAALHSLQVQPLHWQRAVRVTSLTLLALFAFGTFVSWPGTGIVMELTRHPGSVWMPLRAQMQKRTSSKHVALPINAHEWFAPRETRAEIPPNRAPWQPESPIILLLGVDGLRAQDISKNSAHKKHFPFLAKLLDEGVVFSNARSPGSQTVYTYSSIFSCKYFSQLYWEKIGGQLWPGEDTSPRFPELLSNQGIQTFTIAPASWFLNSYGVIRGAAYEEFEKPPKGVRYREAHTLTESMMKQVRRLGTKPGFGFTHYLETHAGMRGKDPERTPFERHLSALRKVDEQLKRLDSFIKQEGLSDRVIYIITSDHGEAYGERGKYGHSFHLYEELIRVPLIVHAKNLSPREINEAVSLVDLGPTILDLFNLNTPGQCMGQSLSPALIGKPFKYTRPIVAEGRLKKAMLFDDRYKVILDDHNNTEEAYDLRADPKEQQNLLIDEHEEAENLKALTRQFFDAHSLKRPDYQIPYRK